MIAVSTDDFLILVLLYSSLFTFSLAVFIFSFDSATTDISTLSLHDALPISTFDWDIVRTPGGPAGDVQAVGQSAIVALTAGEHHEAALDFLAYLTNRENRSEERRVGKEWRTQRGRGHWRREAGEQEERDGIEST